MPELPEVETIRRQLSRYIVGKRIKKIQVSLPKMVKLSLFRFQNVARGSAIKSVNRRGKILIFDLDNRWSMLLHLKLSGRLIFRRITDELRSEDTKWNHIIYYFTNGSRLFHNDLRQFGYVKLIKTKELPAFFKKEKLGPEPLEKTFTYP